MPMSWNAKRGRALAFIVGAVLGSLSSEADECNTLRVRGVEVVEAVRGAFRRLGLHCEAEEYYDEKKRRAYFRVLCHDERFTEILESLRKRSWKWINGYEVDFLRGFLGAGDCQYMGSYIMVSIRRVEYVDLAIECLDRLGMGYSICHGNEGYTLYIPMRELSKARRAIRHTRYYAYQGT
ncbi:MAG: hypothetical protein DRN15_05195 [Thermoprotei archaeon]|nr:MAG: hypothetical protein DRN15_05195 [Thermoprotei archaeon]RLF24637.1 MAG: hypothetical protein DRM97_03175 [Thermoprotei archaeon]